MSKYETPILELIELEEKDIICTSGRVEFGGWSGDEDTEWVEE